MGGGAERDRPVVYYCAFVAEQVTKMEEVLVVLYFYLSHSLRPACESKIQLVGAIIMRIIVFSLMILRQYILKGSCRFTIVLFHI